MFLLLALLSLIILPSPWGLVVALASGAAGIIEVVHLHRRMRGRKVQTGAENLVGATGEVTEPLMPLGQIRVLGELWQARSSSELPRGTTVRVVALSGLTVEVEAAQYDPRSPM
jgi:membrane-bound serine protease (ClpP class)